MHRLTQEKPIDSPQAAGRGLGIPTQPIGSIPRPPELIEARVAFERGQLPQRDLDRLYDEAMQDTIDRFEATGSPVISDGEQRKFHNFATYCVHGATNLAPDGFKLQFVDHHRQWPRVERGPFRYVSPASHHLAAALAYARRPVKQAVISPSALSLFYPAEPLDGYTREQFIGDVIEQHAAEVSGCLAAGAHTVQIDFTEGRLACKLDPTGQLLASFVQLNNMALSRFSEAARRAIGVHTCPGGDRDSTHSADVDYAELLPTLFELQATQFFIALAREPNRPRVLAMIRRYLKPQQRAFVGVIDPLDPRVETPEEVRDRVLEAAEYIPLHQLGTTDDCGFAPFSDDRSTSRDTAFEKIKARVVGTHLAEAALARRRKG
jgi:5-methyltetrahydropteroyltriglutamate--homocysteine methyltransferase